MTEIPLGLITGFLFGFLLQKGRVLRFEKQIGALLFKDMTIVKFMLSAVIVGMIGLYAAEGLGWIQLKHKAMNAGAVVLGGLLFGAGWAVMGYCPGTSIGAIGEGRWHALWAALGMTAGAALYAEAYPFLKKTVLAWTDFGKIALPGALGWNPLLAAAALTAAYVALFFWFEKKRL